MLKRYLWAVLVILALVMTSCGGSATPAPAEPTAAPAQAEPTQAPEPTAAPEPTQAPAATEAPAAAEAPAATKPLRATPAATGSYSESPMLTEMVKAGTLPPVEERLPQEPFVVGPGTLISQTDLPDWQPGKYGGTLHFAHAVANWNPDIFIMLNENLMCAPGIGLAGLQGCVAKDVKAENDNKEFTITLRKGLKWSDGVPVTTEDVKFVWEDVYGNDKITPTFPAKFRDGGRPDGNPAKLDIIDDYTFKLTFGEPYGGLLREISVKGWQGYTDLILPKHYLQQWHINYTPIDDPKMQDELSKLNLKDEWWQVFAAHRCNNWDDTNPRCAGFPTLGPWVAVTAPSQVLAFDRNPYYYKVDTQGQQLPYIDKLVSQQVLDVEALTMKVLAGEVDFVRESTALVKLPLYKENEEKADIHVQLMDNHVDPTCLFLNNTYADENFKKTVNDVRFRQALSYGINRQEIIDSVYFGYAQMPKLVPSEYNVDKANQLLDEMGMDKKDADGYRLGLDGKPFTFLIEHGAHAPDIAPAAELVAVQLKDIGLKVQVKQLESSLWGQRAAANDLQATILWDVQPMWADGTWTDYAPGQAGWAPLWQQWHDTNGQQGEEPPAAAKELYTIMENRSKAVPYSDEDKQLVDELYKNYSENSWILPLAEKVNYAMVVSNKLGNMPISGQAIGADYSGEQFFFK